jgi:dolichyl-phosphate-mannose-protein mannosyltransferase
MQWLALKAIFGLSIVTVAGFGAGTWIGLLLPSSYRRFERIAFVLLGGFGILSSTLFLVGQFSFAQRSIYLTLAIAIAFGIALFRRVFPHEARVSLLRPKIPEVPAIVISSVLLFTAVSGLAEITGDWNSDTVSYHLLGPKVWLRDGAIRPVLDDCHTAFPQIPETLFATFWSVGGSRAPNFSSFLTLGLLLAIAASIAVRLGLSDRDAWWVAAIVATMPAVYAGAHGCFVDAIFAAFVIAAVRIGFDAESLREWAVFGIFCGFAIGTKYTGLLAFPALLLCILLLNIIRNIPHSRGIAGKLAVAIAVACLVGSPYYVRNWVLLGCPIYPPPPGYALICSPKHLSPDAISQFHVFIRQRGIGLGRGFFAFLLLPFNLTYHTSNFHGGGGIGLCPFALGPIGILWSRKNALIRMLILLMFLLTSVWFLTQQESRFLIHVYVLGAIFSVLGWHRVLACRRKLSKYLAGSVVFVSCAYGLFMIGRANIGDVKAVFSESYAAFKHRTSIPYLPSFEYFNYQQSVRRVLILDRSVMPYYSDKDYVKPIGQWGERTLPGEPSSLQALELAREHQLNVSHVMDVNSELSSFQVNPNLPGLVLVFEAENQRIYRVK